ncbi:MAG: DUF72 domain-containing protein [Pseudomonadota bacterium]|nr:MAG: DUF72 domain-containing protein [Pseudomonadota bacterium]
MPRIRVGISGFRYAAFRGVFYPKGLPARCELAYAAARFDTIELNGSFYSLQRPHVYTRFRDETPDDFEFAVKGSRFITHMKKLRDVTTALANFFASGVLCLERKLGPILWQLPPNLAFSRSRFEEFFELLPRDTFAAVALARHHDARVEGRSALATDAKRRIRHAVEVRSPKAATPELVELLRRHRIALVVSDSGGRFPYLEDVTTDFVYVRLHGDVELYASGYSPAKLRAWARRIAAWHAGGEPPDAVRVAAPLPERRAGRDVYVYFDNDAKVRAPFDALALARELGRRNAATQRRAG